MASDVITFRVDYAPRVSIRYLYFTLFYFHEKFSLRQFKRPPKVIERKIRVPKARPNLGRRNRCVEIIFQHIIKTLTFTRKLAIIFANHWINGKLKLIRERETFPGRGEAARQSQPSLEKMGKSGTKRTRSFSPLQTWKRVEKDCVFLRFGREETWRLRAPLSVKLKRKEAETTLGRAVTGYRDLGEGVIKG